MADRDERVTTPHRSSRDGVPEPDGPPAAVGRARRVVGALFLGILLTLVGLLLLGLARLLGLA